MRLLGTMVVVMVLGAGARSQGPEADPRTRVVPWESELDLALKRAQEAEMPLMIVLTTGVPPCDALAATLRREDVRWECRHFLCVAASPVDHTEERPPKTLGLEAPPPGCPHYTGVSCAAHQDLVTKLEQRGLLESGAGSQVLFVHHDGKQVLARHPGLPTHTALLDMMRDAVRRHAGVIAQPARAPVVKAVIAQSKSRTAGERQAALDELTKMDHALVVRHFERVMRSGTRLRLEAIMIVGESRQVRFAKALSRLLKSSKATTRTHAAVALSKIRSPKSVAPLAAALGRERKKKVQGHLLRALAACAIDPAIVQRRGTRMLRETEYLGRIAALYVATTTPLNADLRDALKRCLGASERRVRSAAYVVVGARRITGWQRPLSRRLASERNLARTCCEWALVRLGSGKQDPDDRGPALVRALLPDGHLYEGRLTPSDTGRFDFRRR
ncbi:MAG: hypothetical protein CMJ83_05820 [Planctomycetes bacterium]|nr:hypothetical protein [Planctomycetota bacterium]